MAVSKRLEGRRGRMWKGSWRLNVGVNYIGVKADSVPTWDPWIGVGCGAGSSCSLAELGDPHLTLMSLAPLLDTHDNRGASVGFGTTGPCFPSLGQACCLYNTSLQRTALAQAVCAMFSPGSLR